MSNRFLLLFIALSAFAIAVQSPIKIVVVLVMENRSFDHMLGFLHKLNPEIDGLKGDEQQHYVADDPTSKFVKVNSRGFDISPTDPGHGFASISEQIYGIKNIDTSKTYTPKMNGFVQNALHSKSIENPMSMFNITSAPIINTLATDFSVFDKWYVSVPGPTDPNRQYLMSGTSKGWITNFNGTFYDQKSYFQFLSEHKISWGAYYQDDPWAIMYFKDMHTVENVKHVHGLDDFFKHIQQKTLPQFNFLQPRMTSLRGPPTWQHPDASIAEGERLIKKIYEALRQSSYWDQVAFIITYDEHGGFYDHVPPPQTGVPPPDGIKASNGFKFDRLGVRVPMVVASPWIPKGTVVHEPKKKPFPSSQFDGTSIISTANKIFGISEHLTKRTAWAGTFEDIFSLKTPRTDCPLNLASIPKQTEEEILKVRNAPLSDHLKSQVDLYCQYNGHGDSCSHRNFKTNYEASLFIDQQVGVFFKTLDRKNRVKKERVDV